MSCSVSSAGARLRQYAVAALLTHVSTRVYKKGKHSGAKRPFPALDQANTALWRDSTSTKKESKRPQPTNRLTTWLDDLNRVGLSIFVPASKDTNPFSMRLSQVKIATYPFITRANNKVRSRRPSTPNHRLPRSTSNTSTIPFPPLSPSRFPKKGLIASSTTPSNKPSIIPLNSLPVCLKSGKAFTSSK